MSARSLAAPLHGKTNTFDLMSGPVPSSMISYPALLITQTTEYREFERCSISVCDLLWEPSVG